MFLSVNTAVSVYGQGMHIPKGFKAVNLTHGEEINSSVQMSTYHLNPRTTSVEQ
jgi:hypothetical protein